MRRQPARRIHSRHARAESGRERPSRRAHPTSPRRGFARARAARANAALLASNRDRVSRGAPSPGQLRRKRRVCDKCEARRVRKPAATQMESPRFYHDGETPLERISALEDRIASDDAGSGVRAGGDANGDIVVSVGSSEITAATCSWQCVVACVSPLHTHGKDKSKQKTKTKRSLRLTLIAGARRLLHCSRF